MCHEVNGRGRHGTHREKVLLPRIEDNSVEIPRNLEEDRVQFGAYFSCLASILALQSILVTIRSRFLWRIVAVLVVVNQNLDLMAESANLDYRVYAMIMSFVRSLWLSGLQLRSEAMFIKDYEDVKQEAEQEKSEWKVLCAETAEQDARMGKGAKRVFVGAGARALFYPTLLYNVVRNKLQAEFRWWDEVDQV
eukprot:Gb_23510 [translate_table: standard]